MNTSFLRVGSLILLVLAVLALSGVGTTVEAVFHAEKSVACCEKEADQNNAIPEPCSEPDCSCAICLAMDLASLSEGSRVLALEIGFHPHEPLIPARAFLQSIDQPPESF